MIQVKAVTPNGFYCTCVYTELWKFSLVTGRNGYYGESAKTMTHSWRPSVGHCLDIWWSSFISPPEVSPQSISICLIWDTRTCTLMSCGDKCCKSYSGYRVVCPKQVVQIGRGAICCTHAITHRFFFFIDNNSWIFDLPVHYITINVILFIHWS